MNAFWSRAGATFLSSAGTYLSARRARSTIVTSTSVATILCCKVGASSRSKTATEWACWLEAGLFAAAAEAMRRILVENARRKLREKHGGGLHRVDMDLAEEPYRLPNENLLALDEALTKLEAEDPNKAKLVQLRFFAGLTNDEAANALGVSAVTVKRHWRYARAWLHREISSGEAQEPS